MVKKKFFNIVLNFKNMSVTIAGITSANANAYCGQKGISQLLIVKHSDVSGVTIDSDYILTALTAAAKVKYSFFENTATYTSVRESGSALATQTITYENIGRSNAIFKGNETLANSGCFIAIAKNNDGSGVAFGISCNLETNGHDLKPAKVGLNESAGLLTDTDYTKKTTTTIEFMCRTAPIEVDSDLLTTLFT